MLKHKVLACRPLPHIDLVVSGNRLSDDSKAYKPLNRLLDPRSVTRLPLVFKHVIEQTE